MKKSSIYKLGLPVLLVLLVWSCNEVKKEAALVENQRTKIEMVTDYGTMIIELYNETPLHRDNFVNLSKHKAYDSILFHRVIEDFMIQAGDPDSKTAKENDTLGEGDVPYKVAAEFDTTLFHKKGVLAAARDDHPEKASSGMQFYIVQGRVFTDSTLINAEKRINQYNAKSFFEKNGGQKSVLDSAQHAIDIRNIDRFNFYMDSLLSLAKTEKDFKPYSIPENQRAVYKSVGGTPHLDQNYTVFGELVEGLAVFAMDRPIKDVRIQEIRVLESN